MTREPLQQSLQRAAAALKARRFDEVRSVCGQVLGTNPDEANALMFLGLAELEGGSLGGGILHLERARRANPRHQHVLSNLGSAYRSAGRLPEARAALEAAVAIDPRFAAAHYNLGNALHDLGERSAAERHYLRAVEIHPSYAEALAALASIAEASHRLPDALARAQQTLRLSPGNHRARLVYARVLMRDGKPAEAAQQLSALLEDPTLSDVNRTLAHGRLGDACDALGDYDAAYREYSAANEIEHRQHAAAFARDRGAISPAMARRLRSLVAETDASLWRHGPARDEPPPVFLVGFPRSGTTLLEQILASHPDVCTLQERAVLADTCEGLLKPDARAADWAALTTGDVAALQAAYVERAAQGVMAEERRPMLVDKLPLNAILLPAIARIFPEARVILALRDPRDTVTSCFQQRFGMNDAMYQLLRLDTTADFYDGVMSLVRESRARLPLRVHEIRYEDLIGDFDATIGGLLSFLGLPWRDEVRAYADTARRRSVQTPSASQVVQPLYRGSLGKWRHYRRHLEPVLPVLEPWVAAYGYEPS